jgi:3-hydroxyisobutyrate dehydrogenase-like beta-hydroxyacid dehydrogenase
MRVGFIGLGNMGSEMALNLLNAGHEVTGYNRTASKLQALVALGAHAAAQPADACRGDVVITMLTDDAAVEGVAFGETGIIAGLGKDAIHISMSTISVALSERLAAAHAKAGQRYVSAPVFGRPEAAVVARLFIASAGPTEALDACMPLFEAMGQKTFRIGNKAPTANMVKLSGNFLIASASADVSRVTSLLL